MNMQWSDFLRNRSEQSYPTDPSCALNDLSHFGLIRVEGEDAMQFLQGQFTNDIREVTEQHSNLSAWCSPKGRMLANFRVMRRDPAYLLQIPLAQLEPVIKRLRMFVLRAKVTITDASDEWTRFGLTGDCAESLLQPHFERLPKAANAALVRGDNLLVRMPGPTPRFELLGPAAELIPLWETCEAQATPMDSNFWALQEIRAGIPTVYPETREAFVPQMTNMQLIDGVSFTKGCYTGQEVVARMQYLGKLKRRMYLAHVRSETPPEPGDELFARGSSSGQGAGRVVDARAAGDGYDLLAVIELESLAQHSVHLGENGPPLEILQLPYDFASETV
jgi:folate-binding protein YgfZ